MALAPRRLISQAAIHASTAFQNVGVMLGIIGSILTVAGAIVGGVAVRGTSAQLVLLYVLIVCLMCAVVAMLFDNVLTNARARYAEAVFYLHRANHILRDFWALIDVKRSLLSPEWAEMSKNQAKERVPNMDELVRDSRRAISESLGAIYDCYRKLTGADVHVALFEPVSTPGRRQKKEDSAPQPPGSETGFHLRAAAHTGFMDQSFQSMIEYADERGLSKVEDNELLDRIMDENESNWCDSVDDIGSDREFQYRNRIFEYFYENGFANPYRSWMTSTISVNRKKLEDEYVTPTEFLSPNSGEGRMNIVTVGFLSILASKPYVFKVHRLDRRSTELLYAFADGLFALIVFQRRLRQLQMRYRSHSGDTQAA